LPVEAYGVTVVGGYVYVADGENGLYIYDVSDPTNPVQMGHVDTYFADDVAVAGAYAYVADETAGLRIIDVSNPAYPFEVASYNTWPQGRGREVTIMDHYALVAGQETGLWVVDISVPSSPVEIGWLYTPGEARGISEANNTIYVAALSGGLDVLQLVSYP
jgi:hypothetical protein